MEKRLSMKPFTMNFTMPGCLKGATMLLLALLLTACATPDSRPAPSATLELPSKPSTESATRPVAPINTPNAQAESDRPVAVSYTHLTLPTICSV